MKKSEKTELTVSKIMKTAITEFGTNGYVGSSLNNICKSGINKGLIYHNFRDKDELYLKCLEKSRNMFVSLIEESDCLSDLVKYMNVRMSFFRECPHEAHIFFEAVLQPQKHLWHEIKEILQPFYEINETVYRSVVSNVELRDGITENEAVEYFRLIQRMFNGYFSSQNMSLDEQVNKHETNLPKMLNFMLYGIARGGNEK